MDFSQATDPLDPHFLKEEWARGLDLEGRLAIASLRYPSGNRPDQESALRLFHLRSSAIVQEYGAVLAHRAIRHNLSHGYRLNLAADVDRLFQASRTSWLFTVTNMALHMDHLLPKDVYVPVSEKYLDHTINQLLTGDSND